MVRSLGQRYQLQPLPQRQNYPDTEKWADALMAVLTENLNTISEEPLVPVKFSTATAAVSLSTSFAELGTSFEPTEADNQVLFNGIFSAVMTATELRTLTLRIQRDGTDIYAARTVAVVPTGSGTFVIPVTIAYYDAPGAGGFKYDVDARIDGGAGAASFADRSLIVSELRGA